MAANSASGARRNIVVLSDGTGNSASSPFKTNVWRTYDYLDLANGDQIACYDDGVGTSSNVIWRSITGALGVGLQKNVIDLYLFLSRAYRPGDNLYFFGFSRGAFTIRTLIGLIQTQGLLVVGDDDESKLRARANAMYHHFRRKAFPSRKVVNDVGEVVTPAAPFVTRIFRTAFDCLDFSRWNEEYRDYDEREVEGIKRQVDGIKFVGLWDTVEAYGLPIEEMRTGVDKTFFPMTFHHRDLWEKVERACHALSLDDARSTFHPVLWEEEETNSADGTNGVRKERITQLWFAGAHADVGGGYPDDRLSYVPLLWVMQEAEANGLRFRHGAIAEVERLSSAKAPVHDSRAGAGVYYRYKPRLAARNYTRPQEFGARFHSDETKVDPPVRLHASVRERLSDPSIAYAPLSLPKSYEIYAFDHGTGTTRLDSKRELKEDKEFVLDRIWWRRALYFVFLFLSLTFLLLPILELDDAVPSDDGKLGWINALHRFAQDYVASGFELVGGLLPAFARPWIDAVKSTPLIALVLIALLFLTYFVSARLESRIARSIIAAQNNKPSGASNAFGRRMLEFARQARTRPTILAFYDFFVKQVFPFVFGWAALIACVYLFLVTPINRASFSFAEAYGRFCERRTDLQPPADGGNGISFEIDASDYCGDKGVDLKPDHSYVITAEDVGEKQRVGWKWLALPLRRGLRFGWSDAIVQLSYLSFAPQRKTQELIETQVRLDPAGTNITPEHQDVRLYVYRNNAVISPYFYWLARKLTSSDQPFYAADSGKLKLLIKDVTPNGKLAKVAAHKPL